MLERLQPTLLDKTLESGFWPVEGLLQQTGSSGIEIQWRLFRKHWSIPMPAEQEVGCPTFHEISRKVQQKSEIFQLGELHPTALETHQHIDHGFTATGQFLPLLRGGPVDIQTPGFGWGRGRLRLLLCSDRVWR